MQFDQMDRTISPLSWPSPRPLSAIRHYHFALHNDRSRIEDLGGVVLDDDDEALAFGKRVIRELLHKNPEQHARWTMDITEGERTLCSLPLEFDAAWDQRK